jgi:hypothetical protein
MKTYGGVETISSFLTSQSDEAEGLASHPGRFTPEKEPPPEYVLGGRLGGGGSVGLDAIVQRKPLVPFGNRTPILQQPSL